MLANNLQGTSILNGQTRPDRALISKSTARPNAIQLSYAKAELSSIHSPLRP